MSDERERKPLGIPPFYWAKPPAKPRSPSKGFVNKQQRRLYFVMTGFNLAKLVVAMVVALLIIGMI
jgi:hypothetical protein